MVRMRGIGLLAGLSWTLLSQAGVSASFNPDTDPSRIKWTELTHQLGAVPNVRGHRFGVVLKTPENEYWRLMAAGYRRRAAEDGVKLDIQAARNETDQAGQLSILQNMIGSRYEALLISPISAANLQPAIEDAAAANIPLVDIDGAVASGVPNFVGPMNYEMGVHVADWFIQHFPAGGRVAVIEGQTGVLSTVQRSSGFVQTLLATKKFEIAARASGQWDRQLAFEAAKAIIGKIPALIGIYCNNDTMALGVVDAVTSLDAAGRIKVFGTDGTSEAYESIAAGKLTGTVDIFPAIIGGIGLDVAERLAGKQSVPRVVETPQVLILRDNIGRYNGDEEAKLKSLWEDETREKRRSRD